MRINKINIMLISKTQIRFFLIQHLLRNVAIICLMLLFAMIVSGHGDRSSVTCTCVTT